MTRLPYLVRSLIKVGIRMPTWWMAVHSAVVQSGAQPHFGKRHFSEKNVSLKQGFCWFKLPGGWRCAERQSPSAPT